MYMCTRFIDGLYLLLFLNMLFSATVPPSQPRHGMTSVIHHISSQTEHPPHKKCGTDGVNLTCYLVKTHFGIFEREEDRES